MMKSKILIFAVLALLLISCSDDADMLIEKGEYERAIILLKEELSKDYRNTGLRNKITKLYFTNAVRNIDNNNLDEAERNIERGIIYSSENNPEIKDEYADILVLLGSKLVKTGDREGSVDLKKKYEKGVSLIKKAVALSENNEKGNTLLSEIQKEEAQRHLDLAQLDYNTWRVDRRKTSLLTESWRNLTISSEILQLPYADSLKTKLLESFLSHNIPSNPYDVRILETYFNSENGYIALKIRFYNNSDRDIVVSRSHFTLFDASGKSYKFDVVAAKKGNYRGLLENFKINPDRFSTGLLVFDTSIRRNPVMSKIVWQDDLGNKFEKLFPKIPLTELGLE
ncbi:MAG: DUF4352 domain-containing protein [Candidatus Delongbacteria bacterium]|nr:DUF4352 domain-containing protein [Candidatus Delongbacteria bacterium]